MTNELQAAFPHRFVQQRQTVRDSSATARSTQLEASFGIEVRQRAAPNFA